MDFGSKGCEIVVKSWLPVQSPSVLRLIDRDVKTYERKRLWEWTSKEEFIAFVTKNESPTLKTYSSGWTSQEKMDITAKIKEILDTEFPETETFKVPMIANIVVGHKR